MPRRRVLTVLLSLLVLAAALAAPAPLVQAQENRRAAALGIEVRQGRRAAPGIEVRLRLEGSSLAPTSSAAPPPQITDEQGRAEFWWLTPGIWQIDLLLDGEVAYFLTVRIEAGRRAQEMGAPARDADAPDMRWKFFRPSGPPPTPEPVRRAEAEEPPPPPPPVREPVDETPPPPPPVERPAAEPEPAMEEPAVAEPEMEEPEPMDEPEMSEPEMPEPAAEPMPEPEPEMPEPTMTEPEPAMPPPVAEVEAEEPELPAADGEGEIPDAPLPPGEVPEEEPEAEETAIQRERPKALTQAPQVTRPPAEASEPEELPPPKPQPMQPPALEEPFEGREPAAEEPPMPEPEPEMTPAPVPRPSATPPPPPPAEPAAADAPRFSVRSGAEGNCEECRAPETAVRVERTVPAGDGTCAAGSGAAARRLADRLASRGEGLGAGMPLDGQEVVTYTSGGASCQLFGVVLPQGVRYRGYTYSVADGAGGGGACFQGKQCPIAGALWPNRPTIEELPNGARVVWALFQNASGAALRASLTAYYIAGE